MFAQQVNRRQLCLAQGVERPRQHNTNRAGSRHGNHPILVQILDMVCRKRAVSRRHPGPAKVRQLLGMKLDRQSQFPCHVEHAGHLFRRKGNPLAEPVHRIDKPLGVGVPQGRDHHLDDIGVLAPLVFHRRRMSAQIGCLHTDRARLANLAGRAQHGQFGLALKPITGFDFQHGHTLGDKGIHTRQRLCHHLLQCRRPRRRDSGHNAATGPRHLFIAGPVQAHLEFVGPIAAENNMGVTIHKPRSNQPPLEVLNLETGIIRRNVLLRPNPDHEAINHHHGAFGDQPISRATCGHASDPRAAVNLV